MHPHLHCALIVSHNLNYRTLSATVIRLYSVLPAREGLPDGPAARLPAQRIHAHAAVVRDFFYLFFIGCRC